MVKGLDISPMGSPINRVMIIISLFLCWSPPTDKFRPWPMCACVVVVKVCSKCTCTMV